MFKQLLPVERSNVGTYSKSKAYTYKHYCTYLQNTPEENMK